MRRGIVEARKSGGGKAVDPCPSQHAQGVPADRFRKIGKATAGQPFRRFRGDGAGSHPPPSEKDQPTDLFVLTRRTFEGLQGQAPCVAVRILRQLVLTLAQRLRDANDERVILKGMLEAQAVDSPNIVSSEMLQEETPDA